MSISLYAQDAPIKQSLEKEEDDSSHIMQNLTHMVNGVLTIGKYPYNGLNIIQGLTAVILNFADIMVQILKKREIELIDRGIDCHTATQELERTKEELIRIYAKMILYRNYLIEQEQN